MPAPWHEAGQPPRVWVRDRYLSRAQLVPVPEFDMDIEVRSMTFGERLNYFDIIMIEDVYDGGVGTDWDAYYPALLIPSCWSPARRREDGVWAPGRSTKALWRWDDWDDVNAIRADVLFRLAASCMRMSGMTQDEQSHSFFRMANDGEFRFAFDIAENMHCTVEELGERMSAYEATHWRSYWKHRAWEAENTGKSGARSGEWKTFAASGEIPDD